MKCDKYGVCPWASDPMGQDYGILRPRDITDITVNGKLHIRRLQIEEYEIK